VTAEAAKHSAPGRSTRLCCWTDGETAAFFEARLADAKAAAVVDVDGESNANPQPSKKKKRKRNAAGDDGDGSDDDAALICEHCGGPVPEVSLRVACLDGTTLELTVPQRGLVREVKRAVGQVRGGRVAKDRCHTTDRCALRCFL
jgi:hypothetical protein